MRRLPAAQVAQVQLASHEPPNIGHQSHRTCHVDDPAPPSFCHQRSQSAAHSHHGGNVVVVNRIPFSRFDVRPRLSEKTAGVVNEDIYSFESLQRLRYNVIRFPLLVERIMPERFVCLISRNHPVRKKSFTLAEYLAEKHIILEVEPGHQTLVDRPLSELGKRRKAALLLPFYVLALATTVPPPTRIEALG
jgi:hypothetical protein